MRSSTCASRPVSFDRNASRLADCWAAQRRARVFGACVRPAPSRLVVGRGFWMKSIATRFYVSNGHRHVAVGRYDDASAAVDRRSTVGLKLLPEMKPHPDVDDRHGLAGVIAGEKRLADSKQRPCVLAFEQPGNESRTALVVVDDIDRALLGIQTQKVPASSLAIEIYSVQNRYPEGKTASDQHPQSIVEFSACIRTGAIRHSSGKG